MKLDAKFYGEIRKVKDDTLVPGDELVEIRLAGPAELLGDLLMHRGIGIQRRGGPQGGAHGATSDAMGVKARASSSACRTV